MIAMRNQQNIRVYMLQYLRGAMMLYCTYSTNSIDEIVHAINQLHKNISYKKR